METITRTSSRCSSDHHSGAVLTFLGGGEEKLFSEKHIQETDYIGQAVGVALQHKAKARVERVSREGE